MPPIPTVSPATGNPTRDSFLHTQDCHFVDTHGRTVFLRGVNLSGASKAPLDRPSHDLESLWEQAEAGGESFVGRPLNVDDGTADVHLARLKGWGFNFLRFPVTWEALEHEGPGIYDEEFMDYIIRVLRKCKEYGFKVFMDPHQDVWSRYSGGSGAPFWTLPACGINHRTITATQAALIHSEYPSPSSPSPEEFPPMIWGTNYGRLLSQTVFTLFFAGRDYAPKCIIDGINIQDYLQSHFISAFARLAQKIADAGDLFEDCVIGWDSMNEPCEGLVGWDDIKLNPKAQGNVLKKGSAPTPAQSMRLGVGQPQTVENWNWGTFGPARSGNVTIDPKGHSFWADATFLGEDDTGLNKRWGWKRGAQWPLGECVWAAHGVWDINTGFVLRPDYFKYLRATHPRAGHQAEFIADYWTPHFVEYTKRIRAIHLEAIMFVQPPVFAQPPDNLDESILKQRCAYSPHYYDGLTLVSKHWNWFNADALGMLRGKYSSPVAAAKFGSKAIRASFRDQLGMLKDDANILGDYPTIIGEIGTPFDMDNKRSYGYTDKGKYTGDYSRQETALDASLNAADGNNALGYTVWSYVPDADWQWGDQWNGEDLTLWCPDDLPWARRDQDELGDAYLPDILDSSTDDGSVYSLSHDPAQSQAVLIKKPDPLASSNKQSTPNGVRVQVRPAPSAATSTLSLPIVKQYQPLPYPLPYNKSPSFSQSASTLDPSLPAHERITPRLRSGYHPSFSPYEFLTFGARAVKASARPRALKVVGRVVDSQFDIEGKVRGKGRERGKGPEFRCVVKVQKGDVVRGREPIQQQQQQQQRPGDERREQVVTEIFLPLVHFANEKYVTRRRALDSSPQVQSTTPNHQRKQSIAPQLEETPAMAPMLIQLDNMGSWDAHAVADGVLPEGEGIRRSMLGSASTSSTAITPNDPASSTSSPAQVDLSHISPYPEAAEDLLDIVVNVSEGEWWLEGQILKWRYSVPGEEEQEQESSSAGQERVRRRSDDTDEKEVKIEIWRRGGKIVLPPGKPVNVRTSGGATIARSIGAGPKAGDGGGGGLEELCEKVCSCQCVIM